MILYEIYSNSVGFKPENRKNGDHVGQRVLGEENLVVLAVADGVSQFNGDWDASETTVRSVLERFAESDGDLEIRMAQAVEFAHQEVQNLQGETAGAISTLVFVVWEIGADECRLISVGDSRVFRVRPGDVEQLTVDDSTSRPVKQHGEIVIKDGAAAFTHAITAAIGTREPLDLRVETATFGSGEMMVLSSDGCHELAGFLGFLGQVYDRPDLDEAAESIIYRQNEIHGHDDASLILLRRTDYDHKDQEKYLHSFREGEDFRAAGLTGHFMARVLTDQLVESAGIPDSETMARILDYLKNHELRLTRGDYVRVLDNLRDDRTIETKRVWDRLVGVVAGL